MTVLWRWDFLKSLKSIMPTAVITRLLFFTRPPQSWGQEDGYKTSKNAINLTVLTKIQLFFLNQCFSDFCKPLVNFQRSENVDFDYFYQCSHCFMEVQFLKVHSRSASLKLLKISILKPTYTHTHRTECDISCINLQFRSTYRSQYYNVDKKVQST